MQPLYREVPIVSTLIESISFVSSSLFLKQPVNLDLVESDVRKEIVKLERREYFSEYVEYGEYRNNQFYPPEKCWPKLGQFLVGLQNSLILIKQRRFLEALYLAEEMRFSLNSQK